MQISELVDKAYGGQKSIIRSRQKNNTITSRQLRVIETSFEVLEAFLKIPYDSTDKTAIIIRDLALRAYRSLQASTLLSLSGFEIPVMSLLRDVIEIEILLRYFFSHLNEVEKWYSTDEHTRWKNYRPSVLRKKASGGDNKVEQGMKADYRGHCELGTHPNPVSLLMQQGLRGEELRAPIVDPMFVLSSLHEVAFHAERVSRFLGFYGKLLDNSATTFQKRLDDLVNVAAHLTGDKKVLGVLLGVRLGERKSIREARAILAKISEEPDNQRGGG